MAQVAQQQAGHEPLPYELTLDDVLHVYREALGSTALLVSGFLHRVVPMRNGTAAIAKDGTFYYDPNWFNEWITTPDRLKDICLHEMMHPILNDLAREMTEMGNTAGDAVINSMLFNMKLAPCELFKAFYDAQVPWGCILRPYSTPPSHLVGVYAALYPSIVSNSPTRVENPLEVLNALKILTQGDETEPELIGSHGTGEEATEWDGKEINYDDLTLPGEIQGDLCDKLGDIADSGNLNLGSQGGSLAHILFSVVKSKKSLKTEVLKDFTVRDAVNKMRQQFKARSPHRSIIPTQMSRSEAMQVAGGRPPLFYTVKRSSEESLNRAGIEFYLDVSGSVTSEIPKIIALFNQLRGDVKRIWAFSNEVVEIPIDDFLAGKIQTTWGTDFDCVIDHAVKNGVKKMLIFTDGDAYTDDAHMALAKDSIPRIGQVFFGAWQARDNWVKQHWNISYNLEDLVK